MNPKLQIKKLTETAILPTRAHPTDSGLDLYALEDITLLPGTTAKIRTGVAFGIPQGFEIQLRPRSGLSLKTPLRIANSPATIDQAYTGECIVIMSNIASVQKLNVRTIYTGGAVTSVQPEIGEGFGPGTQVIKKGDRIAQAVLVPIIIPELEEVSELNATDRGANGFGSTGV